MRIMDNFGDTEYEDDSNNINESFLKYLKGRDFVQDINFENIQMANTNIKNITFSKCHFKRCIIPNFKWTNIRFKSCTFEQSRMDQSEYKKCKFSNCFFDNVTLDLSRFYTSSFAYCRAINCSAVGLDVWITKLGTIKNEDSKFHVVRTDVEETPEHKLKGIKIPAYLYEKYKALAITKEVRLQGLIEEVLESYYDELLFS